jgi:chromosome segregation protein
LLIKRLELSGFKSFMNPVRLEFAGGITAILGPNGCGKSNVVDAIRWVMGEQSAKQLRGDKMVNVVFGGTRMRKPLSMAEVSVTFTNIEGRMPLPYAEVQITRRLSRDGTSDYLLNGAPVRLKDVRDLVTDTGAGSHAYSIIEREQVDSVIQGHDDSRRFLLEEASGIMKYRMRRREAVRKLDMTSSDLLRLEDIIEEVSRDVRSLKRQMGRARRYQDLNEKLRDAETWLAQRRLQGYRDEGQRLQAEFEDLHTATVGDDTESSAIAARIEELRAEVTGVERAFRDKAQACEQITPQLRAQEESILVLGERTESTRDSRASAQGEVEVTEQRLLQVRRDREALGRRRTELEESLEERRATFRECKTKLESCEERYEEARTELLQVKQRTFDFAQSSAARRGEIDVLCSKMEAHAERARELTEAARDASERAARLAEELATVSKQIERVERKREERRRQLATSEQRDEELVAVLEAQREERAELRTQLDAARSKLEVLRALVQAYEGYGQGPRRLLERHGGNPRLLGSLADSVHAPVELDAAFDALLHDVIDALLVRDVDSALQLVEELRVNDLGRATLVVPTQAQVEPDASLRDALRQPGVIGRALDLLTLVGPSAATLRGLLSHAVVVEDAEAARRLLAACPDPQLRVATRDGVLFTGHGVLRGGSRTEGEVGLLGREKRLRALEETVARLETEIAEASTRCGATETTLRACRSERRDLARALEEDESELLQLSVTRASLTTAFDECNERCGQAQRSLGEVEAASERLERQLPELTQDAERLSSENETQQRVVSELEENFEAIEREREQQRHDTSEMRVAFVEMRGESESCARQNERLVELERELTELHTRRTQEIERAARDLESWGGEIETARARAIELASALEAARAERDEIGVQLDALRGKVDEEQSRLHALEKERHDHQNHVHQVEMNLSECRMHSENLLERIEEQYGLGEAELLARQFDWSDDDPVPDDDIVRELREVLSRLGPVNLLALEEHAEKSQRLAFLERQRDDLAQASESLRQTIDKINRTACFLFMETFDQVREHFRDTIRTVFDGGDGDLVLTNPSDPLDTDVELRVRPRGKRIDTLTQLSSGERALTAIALLFSIYLVKPSPFCVFDEVDAPLDDANVMRFVSLLDRFKDHTQFIVITHNKLTMEAADYLYGVTMEEEGVSKLVSVALDGKLKGQPRKLRQKMDRAHRVAAVLESSAKVLDPNAEGENGGDVLDGGGSEQAAATVEPALGGNGRGEATDRKRAEEPLV